MTSVWVVRAEFGKHTSHFIEGDYIGIGWIPSEDLSEVKDRDSVYPIYRQAHPNDTSNIVVGQQVGQISRFLFEIRAGDYVITPPDNTEWLHFGRVEADPSYFYSDAKDGCPYRHRRRVAWNGKLLKRSEFSVPFQNTIRSSLTVFAVSHVEEFLTKVGVSQSFPKSAGQEVSPRLVVLNQILELDSAEFEILVGHLLTALGFEGTEVTGKSGDGGVDVRGELNVSNLAKVKLFVQAKRYGLGSKVSATTIRQFRGSIPNDGQGAFITTADYQSSAFDVAVEQGFPRIGLINGHQLVDLLTAHWDTVPQEFQERLGLKPGLVRI